MKRDKKLSKNFSLREFVEAKDIHPSYYPNFWEALKKNKEHQENLAKLANRLQKVRKKLNEVFRTPGEIKLVITSGYRPVEYEYIKGRSGKSQHTLGKAADFVPSADNIKIPLVQIYRLIEPDWAGGLSLYLSDGFIHGDIRGFRVRW